MWSVTKYDAPLLKYYLGVIAIEETLEPNSMNLTSVSPFAFAIKPFAPRETPSKPLECATRMNYNRQNDLYNFVKRNVQKSKIFVSV